MEKRIRVDILTIKKIYIYNENYEKKIKKNIKGK